MKLSRRTNKALPLSTRQGLLLVLAIGIAFAFVFALVWYVLSLPTWSQ